jgi:hypothetical protein
MFASTSQRIATVARMTDEYLLSHLPRMTARAYRCSTRIEH